MNNKFVCVVGLFIWHSYVFAEGRQKRVIHGEELRDRSTASYAAMKYFVWIGFGRSVSGWEIVLPPREWKFDRQVCGGALLTPSIIQTACHCFSGFRPNRNGYGWAERNEHNFELVAGWNVVIDAPQPFGMVKYHIHPRCAKWYVPGHPDGFVTHDFALAKLEEPVQLSSIVSTAPAYPLKELAEMWTDIVAKEAVCLLIGFGRYIQRSVNIKSRVLLHGWHTVTSYRQCYDLTNDGANMSSYQKDASWSCMTPFGPKTTFVAKGDSGSPITCDNRYFSIVSGSGNGADVYDDLIYFAFANSQEYRLEMIKLMNADENPQPYSVNPPDRWTPGTAPPNVFVAVSSAYALKIDLIALLPFLCITLCFSAYIR